MACVDILIVTKRFVPSTTTDIIFDCLNMHAPNLSLSSGAEGGRPPDGTPVMVTVTFHLSMVTIYYLLATAEIIFCTVCLIFNFTQRKKK